MRQARHQEHPRPQGPDDHPAEQGCLRRARHRLRCDRLPGPELDRRALRPAAARRLLLDRDAGDQRLWRPRRRAARSSIAGPRYFAEVIAELLFWIGPDKILFGSRLRDLDAASGWSRSSGPSNCPTTSPRRRGVAPDCTRSRRRSSASTRRGSTTSTSRRKSASSASKARWLRDDGHRSQCRTS